MAFDAELDDPVVMTALGYVVDVSFFVHMFLQFRTAFKKNLRTVTDNRQIAERYLKGVLPKKCGSSN